MHSSAPASLAASYTRYCNVHFSSFRCTRRPHNVLPFFAEKYFARGFIDKPFVCSAKILFTPAGCGMNRLFSTLLRPSAQGLALSLTCCLLLSGCGLFRPSVDTSPAPAAARKVVSTAYSQMGKNYRSGGASPQKGFDCSGLVWWAYRVNGYRIPRVSVEQAHTGQAVAKDRARSGDIVVFRTGRSPRALHTGLYAGGNTFIHSPRQGGKVRMERMDIPYWRSKLVAVRRVVR